MARDEPYTHYLMRGDVLLGCVVFDGIGYRFISNTSSHKSSRKDHATWGRAVPRWARAMITDVLTSAEFNGRNAEPRP